MYKHGLLSSFHNETEVYWVENISAPPPTFLNEIVLTKMRRKTTVFTSNDPSVIVFPEYYCAAVLGNAG